MNRPLDSRQLLAFVTLAQCESFTRAAKQLYLTQGAISHAIKALESEVGSRLVDRSSRQIRLTHAGEQLLPQAERILREMDAARSGLDALSRWGQGRLRVGASTSACQYLIPAVLREFKRKFPKTVIAVEPGDHLQQIEMLQSRRVDLAIMLEPEAQREFEFVKLFTDELCFVAAPHHPGIDGGRIGRDRLADETLIHYTRSSYTYRLITDYFRRERLHFRHSIELGSIEAIKQLVTTDVGIGILAPWVARPEIESGALLRFPLGRRALRRTWGVAHLQGRPLSLGEETFVGLCRTAAEPHALNVA